MEAVIAAVTKINDGNRMPLTIVCHSPGVIQAINQQFYTKWSVNSWKNSKGKEIEYADEWQRITRLMEDKTPEVTARAPAQGEEDIMDKLGAGYFLPHAKLA